MENKKITVIIPVHSVKDNFNELFTNAIKSIKKQIVKPDKVMIVRCDCANVKKVLDEYDFGDLQVDIIENNNGKDFVTQINTAVNSVETEFFSILEFDDEYSEIWFKHAYKYMEVYDDTSVFLPITVQTDEKGEFAGTVNETPWALDFTNVHGFLDTESLLAYSNYILSGAIINTEMFKEIKGLKKNLKLSFIYEFLLRVTQYNNKIMTIPKIGYKHMNMRPNSLFYNYVHSEEHKVTPEETKFWMDAAKKEYFYTIDREINYNN